MLSNYLKYTGLFILLVLCQVQVFENISVMGYATPFLYVYIILKLPIGTNRYFVTILGFLLGTTVDMFLNTPGMNAAATTFLAFFRRPIQGLFFPRDDYDSYVPSISSLGSGFMKYAVFCVFIHHTLLFSIEAFSYFNIWMTILKIFSSTLMTSLLIFGIEVFSTYSKQHERQ